MLSIRPRKYKFKPQRTLQIDWSNPLTQGLVWCAFPGTGFIQELVNNLMPSVIPATNFSFNGRTYLGASAKADATSTGGFAYPWTERLTTIGNRMTMVCFADPDAFVDHSAFMGVPYAASGWVQPWVAIGFKKEGATTSLNMNWAESGSLFGTASDTGAVAATDTFTMYASTRNSTTQIYYRNGIKYGATKTGVSTLAVEWGDKQPCYLLGNSTASGGEGVQGALFMFGIWNRDLSASEILQIYQDPLSLTLPQTNLAAFPPLATTIRIATTPHFVPVQRNSFLVY